MSRQNKLNQGQIEVLLKLYKFRFGTRELIAESLGRNNGTAIYSRLKILGEHGYVAMRFDKSYKLSGRAAEYYLSPKALRLLRDLGASKNIDDKIIKNSYNDKNASDSFIRRCLNIFCVANRLTAIYPGLNFITKRELTRFSYLPQPLPDAYLALKIDNVTRRYLLEYQEKDVQPFLINRRLHQLINYHQEGAWSITDTPFPPILYICESANVHRQLIRQANRSLYSAEDRLPLYSTAMGTIMRSDKHNYAIWVDVNDTDEVYALESITVNP